jgi:glucose/arabinose dehydrogenase
MKALSKGHLRVVLALVATVAVAVTSLVATPAPVEAQTPAVRVVATNLVAPWGMAFLPDGTALVTERDSARLVSVTSAGQVTPIGTVPGVVPGGEGGLMGIAVSPTFATDRYVYLYYTAAADNRIVRFRYENGQIGQQQVLLGGLAKSSIHNGGRIAFGPDGMLYAGVGETGNTALSQDLASNNGKILRMTPEGGPAPGNPFNTLVWSYGHRNVQGLAWDEQGRMYASEFGQNTFDEVNRIEPGNNYGWPTVEGNGTDTQFTNPIATWTTAEASPSGMAYHDGSLWVGGLRGSRLWQVPLLGDGGGVGTPTAHFAGQYGRLRAVESAPDGTLWVATSNRDGRGFPTAQDDRILSITPNGDPGVGEEACVTAANWAHVQAGRATSWFYWFAFASGSSTYLGLIYGTTSLQQTDEATWAMVAACAPPG